MFRTKYLVALIMLFVFIFVTQVTAQMSDKNSEFLQGKFDGEQSAQGNPIWLVAGLGCGCFGLGFAYLSKPEPSAQALIGKSTEYNLGYREGYQSKAKAKNITYAGIGWLVWVAILVGASSY